MALFLGVAIRQAARPMLFSLAKIGLSANFAESAVKKAFGSSWRRQDFLMDYRKIASLVKGPQSLPASQSRYLYPKENMVNVELKLRRRYYILGQATVTDLQTGEESTRYVSLYDNVLRSERKWESELAGILEGDTYAKNLQVRSVSLFTPQHNWDMEY